MSNASPIQTDTVRRRVAVLFFCVLTLAAVDLFVRAHKNQLDEYYVDHYRQKSQALKARKPPPRILLLGSSRAAYGLVPNEFEQITGVTAFNLGIPASKVLEWQLLLDRIVDRLQPELIVLGVNASEIRADYEPVSAARDLFGLNDLVECIEADGWSSTVVGNYLERNTGSAWSLLHRRFELLSYLKQYSASVFPKYAQIARECRLRATSPCPADGYEHPWAENRRLRSLEVQLQENPESVIAASIPPFDPNADAVRRFRELLAHCKARRHTLIVAYLPNSPRVEDRWRSVETQFQQTFERCCREAGIPYLSASQAELPRTNADYLDETHVGLSLAKRISRRIAEHTVRLGLMPNRGDIFAKGEFTPSNSVPNDQAAQSADGAASSTANSNWEGDDAP